MVQSRLYPAACSIVGCSLQDGGAAVCRMALEGCSCKLARSSSVRGRRILYCIAIGWPLLWIPFCALAIDTIMSKRVSHSPDEAPRRWPRTARDPQLSRPIAQKVSLQLAQVCVKRVLTIRFYVLCVDFFLILGWIRVCRSDTI